jgi:two-component system cell cycle sensor histidine kinase PleC
MGFTLSRTAVSMILTDTRHMCPASHRPNRGLFDQERVACAAPEFTVDAAAGLVLGANAGGWRIWGVDPATAAAPLAIEGAMPALQRLREIAGSPVGASSTPEMLTFWTARGVARLSCRVAACGGTRVTVTVEALGSQTATAAAQYPGLGNGQIRERDGAQPDVAHDAWLAHELRTPLSAVIAYAEILKDEHFGPIANPRYKGYARDIYESARHALSVVDSLLRGDPSRSLVPPLAFAELEPVRVVESCLTVARPLAERAGLLLGVQFAPHLPRIVADELSLKQMLLNLLANAIKFARRGDRVTIAVAYEGGGLLHISVADTGPGMAPSGEHTPCAKDGQPGAARPEGAGLGLGLPLTRALATANGAALAIESEPGQGTRATISFGPDRIVVA